PAPGDEHSSGPGCAQGAKNRDRRSGRIQSDPQGLSPGDPRTEADRARREEDLDASAGRLYRGGSSKVLAGDRQAPPARAAPQDAEDPEEKLARRKLGPPLRPAPEGRRRPGPAALCRASGVVRRTYPAR